MGRFLLPRRLSNSLPESIAHLLGSSSTLLATLSTHSGRFLVGITSAEAGASLGTYSAFYYIYYVPAIMDPLSIELNIQIIVYIGKCQSKLVLAYSYKLLH